MSITYRRTTYYENEVATETEGDSEPEKLDSHILSWALSTEISMQFNSIHSGLYQGTCSCSSDLVFIYF